MSPSSLISSAAVVALLAVVMAAAAVPRAEAQLACTEVVGGYFAACILFLQSGGGLPAECCSGLRSLLAVVRSMVERRAACDCLKMLLEGAAEEVLRRAGLLPSTCGISDFPFVIGPNSDC
ncbi:hypothetical protein HPP92_018443 [Vanilla planifolia]|uniref:Non-specific lipid-transfer protein n=1 Tax=Vanilla planifolia TaxID=51239 RepID=A0A835Q9T7_VANPL|nr:hypothetical protein HPP92_018443 [Vanilla planifolia]